MILFMFGMQSYHIPIVIGCMIMGILAILTIALLYGLINAVWVAFNLVGMLIVVIPILLVLATFFGYSCYLWYQLIAQSL